MIKTDIMKKILLIAGVLTIFVLLNACSKKDRVCKCTITKTGTSTTYAAVTFTVPILGTVPLVDTFITPISESRSIDREYKEITKKALKNNCVSYSEPFYDRQLNSVPNFELVTTAEGAAKYDCEIK
jgi:hypothetical protein